MDYFKDKLFELLNDADDIGIRAILGSRNQAVV